MILKNVTKNTIISPDLEIVKNIFNDLFGLLLKSNSRSLLFKTRFGIHTFGLKEPIDVIVLDKYFKVIKLKEPLKPNSLFFWNPKHNFVIELPQKTIRNTNTNLHDQLKLLS